MSDFFGMEASDYLEKLDRLVSGARPETNDFVRLARALRGSAMMASQPTIAAAAGALEAFARALHETRIEWGAGNQQLATRTIDDLKVLVRKLSDWTPEDQDKVAALTAELNGIAGTAPPPRKTPTSGLDTGTRAFIGREGSAVASALQRASQTAVSGRTPPEVADSILQAIQPLRGIASLTDVPPLPDLLDGVDRIATECKRRSERTIANLKEIFSAAAVAIAKVAREVAATGTPDPASDEAARFARLLRSAFEGEGSVIAIEELFFDDAGPHILSRGTGPDSSPMSGVELVAHGEHLRLAADQLDAAVTATQRDLRLQGLEARLVTLATLQGEGVALAVSHLARKLQTTIAGIGTAGDITHLTGHLRAAAAILGTAAVAPDDQLADSIRAATGAIDQPGIAAVPETPVSDSAIPEPVLEPVAGVEPEPAPPVVTQDATIPPGVVTAGAVSDGPVAHGAGYDDAAAGCDMTASYMTYETMLASMGPGVPSLDDLLAGPPVAPVIAVASQPVDAVAQVPEPDPTAAADDLQFIEVEPLEEEPEPVEVAATGATDMEELPPIEDFILPDGEATWQPPAATEDDLVPIEQFLVPVTDFCYDGRDALMRALTLKAELRGVLESTHPERAADLIEEVLDLIELGLGSAN